MLFNSLQFLIFFPIVLLIYYFIPHKARKYWLLVCSYYFYMCWNAKYALLILFSTVVTYLSGRALQKAKECSDDEMRLRRRKRAIIAISLVLNLAVLFFFKYSNFAVDTLVSAFGLFHVTLNIPRFDFVLPVGISFYTFQALSYTIDVYRDEIRAEKSFVTYALFVSFFPQLVAGPIERSKQLLGQLHAVHKLEYDNLREGLLLMYWGFFMKVVLADRISIYVSTVYEYYFVYSGMYIVVAMFLFAIQIYCDFAGYSTIAMGAAKMLGITLMENFDAPHLSLSIAEFWRRWHISLSSWFRDYLYIPLGGNRKGRLRKYINIMIVFLVSGLWHGADFTYVIWGGLHGIYQIAGELLKPVRDLGVRLLHINRDSEGHKLFKMGVTFTLVAFALVIFRSAGVRNAFDIIRSMFVFNPWVLVDGSLYACGLSQKSFWLMLLCIGILLASDICKYHHICIRKLILKQDCYIRWAVFALVPVLLLVFGIWGEGYDAGSFIYFQF